MRVINPRQRQKSRQKRVGPKKRPLILLVLLLLVVGGVFAKTQYFSGSETDSAPSSSRNQQSEMFNQLPEQPPKTGKLRTFTADEFKDFYHKFAYPNTAPINENTPITGNEAADKRLRHLAVQRGYKIRSAPVTNVFVDVGSGHQLQQKAAGPWNSLKAAAQKDRINLGLISAYRPADEQKTIFLQRLYATGATNAGIAAGRNDAQVNQVLRTTALPGYSRHHTGYTIDLTCRNQPGAAFENTICFRWLHDDNYKNAKLHGWIPSYPDGASRQGPDPEAWEYVWVGKDSLIE